MSAKSDVFSFGVMLLEIISGQKNNSFEGEGLAAFVSFLTCLCSFLLLITCIKKVRTYLYWYRHGSDGLKESLTW